MNGSYRYSAIEEANEKWFKNDPTRASLKRIGFNSLIGQFKGISTLDIDFTYPITVISGQNGSGKTTALALAACAFHNQKDGLKLAARRRPYYTFSDFFVTSADDSAVNWVSVTYDIHHNNWAVSKRFPAGVGIGRQQSRKKFNGRWSNYERRVPRDVIYLGIERIVPHCERSAVVSNRLRFRASAGTDLTIAKLASAAVAYVLGKKYDECNLKEYLKYRLPVVSLGSIKYSGFSMGAGEAALFEVFLVIFSTTKPLLLLIDEIELGLHEAAQKRFIKKLTELVKERKFQIICTSHSPFVIQSVPPEARRHFKRDGEKVEVMDGLASAYAASLMGDQVSEITVILEDASSKRLLEAVIHGNLRSRVSFAAVGSKESVIRCMAAARKLNRPSIAYLDGDAKAELGSLKRKFLGFLETSNDADSIWFDEFVSTLPGNGPPEEYIWEKISEDLVKKLSVFFKTHEADLFQEIEKCSQEEIHQRFASLSSFLGHGEEHVFKSVLALGDFSGDDEIRELQQRLSSALIRCGT